MIAHTSRMLGQAVKIPPEVLKEPPAAKAHVTILVNDKVSNI